MMLADTGKIDVLSTTPTGAKRLIIVVEDGEWKRDDRLLLLQEKVNGYASFALDGEMYKRYPDSRGARVSIVLKAFDIPADVGDFVNQMRPLFEAEGLSVEVELLPSQEAA